MSIKTQITILKLINGNVFSLAHSWAMNYIIIIKNYHNLTLFWLMLVWGVVEN